MAKTLSCTQCPNKSEDLDVNSKAWNGWQIAPVSVCPDCITKDLKAKGFEIILSHKNGRYMNTLVYRGFNA